MNIVEAGKALAGALVTSPRGCGPIRVPIQSPNWVELPIQSPNWEEWTQQTRDASVTDSFSNPTPAFLVFAGTEQTFSHPPEVGGEAPDNISTHTDWVGGEATHCARESDRKPILLVQNAPTKNVTLNGFWGKLRGTFYR